MQLFPSRVALSLLLVTPLILAGPVEYEAASIKVNLSGSTGTSSHGSKGQVTFTNQTLKGLIERAYEVQPFQVTGPAWIDIARFDIVAKYPADVKAADRALMLRSLLEDRFRLRIHREKKEMAGYAMTLAKGGFRLKPVDAGADGTSTRGTVVRHMTATALSMRGLGNWAMRYLGQPVVDRSGVEGVYNFEFDWTDDDLKNEADAAPSLFTAIEQTLGLRFHSEKVPVEVVAVDSAEQTPAEN